MLKAIKNYVQRRYGGKHMYIPVEDVYNFYEEFKFHIKGHIRAEFTDKDNEKCVSINKKKLFNFIEQLNPK